MHRTSCSSRQTAKEVTVFTRPVPWELRRHVAASSWWSLVCQPSLLGFWEHKRRKAIWLSRKGGFNSSIGWAQISKTLEHFIPVNLIVCVMPVSSKTRLSNHKQARTPKTKQIDCDVFLGDSITSPSLLLQTRSFRGPAKASTVEASFEKEMGLILWNRCAVQWKAWN